MNCKRNQNEIDRIELIWSDVFFSVVSFRCITKFINTLIDFYHHYFFDPERESVGHASISLPSPHLSSLDLAWPVSRLLVSQSVSHSHHVTSRHFNSMYSDILFRSTILLFNRLTVILFTRIAWTNSIQLFRHLNIFILRISCEDVEYHNRN